MINRRQFTTVAAATALGLARGAWGEPIPPQQRIIDTHLHVWDRKRLGLPWLAQAGEKLNRDYTPLDYAAASRGLHIMQGIYIEVGADPADRVREAQYVQQLCGEKQGVIRAAVVAGSPGRDGFADFVRRLARDPHLKGIRESYRRGSHRDEAFLRDLRLMGELGWRFELLLGADELGEAVEIASACRKTRFVLDHVANPSSEVFAQPQSPDARTWRDGIARIADQRNVFCKISGIPECSRKPNPPPELLGGVVDHCLDRFGQDRVMFGGNWPVCLSCVTLAQWIELLERITASRPAAFRDKLLYGNAVRFYELVP